MNQLQLQVTSNKPFGKSNEFLNFAGNGPTGPIEGISWESSNHHFFTPGNTLLIAVGQTKADGACFSTYKDKTRLEVSKGADIAFAQRDTAPQQPPQHAQTPQGYQQPAPAYNAPQGPPAAHYGGVLTIDQMAAKIAECSAAVYYAFSHYPDIPAEVRNGASIAAGTIMAQWFHGEKFPGKGA